MPEINSKEQEDHKIAITILLIKQTEVYIDKTLNPE